MHNFFNDIIFTKGLKVEEIILCEPVKMAQNFELNSIFFCSVYQNNTEIVKKKKKK